uniref:Uncharacterized protein n=1 Tax=Anopheles epiroticus TaxID=199890 RepID=A0A182P100_9DIPT
MSTEHPAAGELLVNATAATAAAVSSTAKANIAVRVTEAAPAAALAIDPIINHVGDGIFLQAKTAQIFAGICVWMALFITCQQHLPTVLKNGQTISLSCHEQTTMLLLLLLLLCGTVACSPRTSSE